MKLNRLTTSLTLKALFLLALLLSNMYVESSEKIKMEKTISKYESLNSRSKNSSKKSTKRSSTKSNMEFMEKFKHLIVGFLAALATKALTGKPGDTINHMVVTAVDWCFESTVNEFTEIKKKMVKDSPCDPDGIKELIGSEYDEIQSKCAQWETTMKMDSNEFSTVNVLLGKVKNVFTDNDEYVENYRKFKQDKVALNELDKQYTLIYKPKFKKIKDDQSPNISEKVKKAANVLYKHIDGIFVDDTLCESLRDCSPLGMVDYLKIIWGSSIGFLKCAVTAQLKDKMWYLIHDLIKKIFDALGVKILTTIAAGLFPGILLGLMIKFIINNWSLLKKFYDNFFKLKSDGEDAANAERDLWNAIGRIIGTLLFAIIGVRRRKLKKFRKFDTKLY